MEYLSEKEVVASESFYQTIQKDWFGNAQTVINVRTGPTSLLSLAVYSSYTDAEKNLPKRKEFQKIVKDKFTVVDSFYYEGDITYFEGSKAHEIETAWREWPMKNLLFLFTMVFLTSCSQGQIIQTQAVLCNVTLDESLASCGSQWGAPILIQQSILRGTGKVFLSLIYILTNQLKQNEEKA